MSKSRLGVFERLEERRLLAAGVGVTAQYFSDTELTSLVATRIESGLVQDWGSGAPVAGLTADQFSARFVGQVEAKFTELHAFTLAAEGGARLWINGIKVIDRWADASFTDTSANVELVAGRRYDIQLEFRETGGLANLNLRWASASMPTQPIAMGSLFPSERGSVERRVWNSVPGDTIASLTGLSTFPNQPSNSTSLTSLETVSTGLDQYGQLLVGKLYPTKTGQYRFYIAGDDAAELWLSNSASSTGKQKIAFVTTATGSRDWTASASQQSAVVSLVAGQAYAFEVIHKENSGSDHVAVGWKQPDSNTIEVIDGQYLAPPLPTVRVFSKRSQAIEGDVNPIEFVVQRSSATFTNPLTVSYTVGGSATSGSDFVPKSGSVTIPAGSAVASVLVTPLSDAVFESPETVQLELVDGPGYEVGLISERQSVGTIQNVGSTVPGGTIISPAMVLGNYQAFGGSFSQISPAAPFSAILQATVATVPTNLYDAQLRFLYSSAIQQGEVLWADFYVRSIGGTGKITALSEKNSAPFTKSLFQGLSITTDWARVQLPFVSLETYAPGTATFGFYLGAQVQTLQFADITVRNYGRNREITPMLLTLHENEGEWGFESTIAVSGQAFSTATQITTTALPTNGDSWKLQYGGTNAASIRSGDNVQLEFFARSVSGANPRVAVAVQQSSEPYDTYTFQTINLSGTWQRYLVNTTVPVDFDAGKLQAMLNVGFDPQTVQFAAIKWTNLSANVNFSELPLLVPSSTTYGGSDAQDAWRVDADQRIAATRQSKLTVDVVDSNGTPVDGAVVSIRQTKQSFLFGSAIDGAGNLLSSAGGSDAIKYQSEIKRLFNAVTIENSLKWPSFWQNRQQGIDVVNWVTANGLYLRGHNVVWPSERNMPASIWTTYRDKLENESAVAAAAYMRSTIQARIQDAVGTFASQAAEWDVVNEPYDNAEVMAILGNQVLVDWFLQARQVDPDVARVLNDYDIFARNGNNTAHRTNFDGWLTLLKANNAIERIGEQSHYNESNLTDIPVLGQLIQTYHTQFGLPIAITEFDVESSNVQLQADYLRDYMKMLFSQSAVDQFIQWGFWSKAHWKPTSALYNADFSIRPNGQVYEDLVFGNWWTDTRGTTRNGNLSADVFEGDYTITVSIGNQVVTRTVQGFTANGAVSISLPGAVWSSSQLTGTEGNPSTLTAVLSQAPTSNVIVTLPSTSQITVSPAQLTFTPANWNVAQTMVVTPIEDNFAEGAQTARVDASLASADRNFNNSVTTPITILFNDQKLTVSSLDSLTSELAVRFSKAIDVTKLNLVDSNGVNGASDLTLVGSAIGAVKGSLVLDADATGFKFVKSGGPFAADTYTLRLRSAANGFVDTAGTLLDGNADGTVGDDFVRTFTVGAIPANAVVLSVPDFQRGPGQTVNLPATSTNGLPITISTGSNVKGVSFELNYNPALLTITGGTTSIVGASVTVTTPSAGVARVTVTSAAQFSATAGTLTLVNLTAAIPTTASIGSKALLRLSNVSLTSADGSVLSIVTDNGLQISAYKGDVNNSNSITTGDVTGLLRSISGALSTTGFPNFKLADPTIVGDMNDSNTLTTGDATGFVAIHLGCKWWISSDTSLASRTDANLWR